MLNDLESNVEPEGEEAGKDQLEKVLIDLRKLVELVKGESRVKIFYYLLIYRELSLSRLSELMRKPKSTVHHHIDKMLKEDLLKKEKRKKDVYYSFSDTISIMLSGEAGTIKASDAKGMKPEEQFEMSNLMNASMKAVFLIIRNTVDLVEEFTDRKLEEESLFDMSEETALSIGLMPLTEDEHELYENGIKDLIEKLREMKRNRKKEQEKLDTPYLSLVLLVPIREILQTLLKSNK